MKLNWGHGIALAVLAFVAFISALVWRCMQEKVDFVTTSYYEKELTYQDRIDRERNALSLAKDITVEVQRQSGQIAIRYPDQLAKESLAGEVSFYKPDNSALDFTVPVQPGQGSLQLVSSAGLRRGLWKVMVNWSSGKTPYYYEQKILLN